MQPFTARHHDCLLKLTASPSPTGRSLAILTVEGAGTSDDVARCLESVAAGMGEDFAALSRYAIDIQLYAGRFTISGLLDQAAVFAAHGVTELRFCYLMKDDSFDLVRALLIEVFGRRGVALTPNCRPTLHQALTWLDEAQ